MIRLFAVNRGLSEIIPKTTRNKKVESGAIRRKGLKSRLWVRLLYFKCKAALHIAVRHCKSFGDCNLRSCGSGVAELEAWSQCPAHTLGEKNREMKAKKERGGLLFQRISLRSLWSFKKCFPWKKSKNFYILLCQIISGRLRT